MATLPPSLPGGRTIIVRAPRNQLREISALQRQSLELSKAPGHNSLSIGFKLKTDNPNGESIKNCDTANSFPTMAVWVKLEENERYSRLLGEKAFQNILAESLRDNHCEAGKT